MPLTSCSRFGYGPECSREEMSPETWKQEGRAPCPAAAGATERACREASPHGMVGLLLSRSAVGCDRAIMGKSGRGKVQFCFHCTAP